MPKRILLIADYALACHRNLMALSAPSKLWFRPRSFARRSQKTIESHTRSLPFASLRAGRMTLHWDRNSRSKSWFQLDHSQARDDNS